MKSPDRSFFEAILIAAILLSVALLPLVVEAQSPEGPPSFSDFDANGDGFLSEEELNAGRAERMAAMAQEGRQMKGAATRPEFQTLDADGDGKISESEFTTAQQAHREAMHAQSGGKGMGQGQGQGKGKGKNRPTFEDLDLDGDGCISAQEFADRQARHQAKMKQ